jgi:copper chaperone CopZ
MSRITSLSLVLAVALGWLHANEVLAQYQPAPTVITVPKMCCGGCAKKVAAKLTEVPGIGGVQPNVQTKTITVIAKPQAVLSPRALWEAIEQAGQQPTKLEGPSGTFTAKPQF